MDEGAVNHGKAASDETRSIGFMVAAAADAMKPAHHPMS
jgi:hypothetical protein